METPHRPDGAPFKLLDPMRDGEGTAFDKPPPTAPPQAAQREIPTHLKKVVQFFSEVIADEGLLLDLCVDRAVGIVEFNYKKRAFGSDFFSGEQPTPLHFVGMAAPLAVELYKQVLLSVKDRAEEYEKILEQAKTEMSGGPGKAPIILPP